MIALAAALLLAQAGQPAAQQGQPAHPAGALTLAQLQDLARRNDPRAQQARAQVENAEAKRDEVHRAVFPVVTFTANLAGPTPEERLLPNPRSLLDVTPGSRCYFCGKLGVEFGISANFVMPIFTFGKLTAGRNAINNLVEAMAALAQRSTDQATFDVTRAYWGYQTARGARSSILDVRRQLTSYKERARKLLAEESDQVTKADSMKLDYAAEEIEARHAQSEKGADLALTAIRLIIGKEPQEPLDIVEQTLPDPPPQPNEDEMLRRALEKRPELRAAAAQVAGRRAAADLEHAKLFPDLALVGGGAYTKTTSVDSLTTPFANNPFQQEYIFAAFALQGTLDFPQKFARIRQAEAELRDALAQQRGAEQLVRLELRQALGDLREARVRAERYSNETAIGKKLAVEAGLAFDSGLGDARELFEDVLLYARADGERFSALFDAQIAWASLQRAVGGL